MSLPLQAVERLFARLNATYGRDFMTRYEGVDDMALKSSWAHELSGFVGHLHSIAWALENLPMRAPNVLEFRELCRKAPQIESPEDRRLRLEHLPAGADRVKAELAKLAPTVASVRAPQEPVDHKSWARRLLSRHEAGEVLKPIQLRYAREALRITPHKVVA